MLHRTTLHMDNYDSGTTGYAVSVVNCLFQRRRMR